MRLIDGDSGLLQLGWFSPLPGDPAQGWSALDLSNRGINAYSRRFYYTTTLLPASVTANRTSLTVLLGGWGQVNGYTTTRTL